jgi:CO/xanthine dehydrogenase FAD-binding subunit
MGEYLRPKTLTAALEALAERPLRVLAGGTDHYPARLGGQPDEDLLDITAIKPLRLIEDKGDHWRIGALATWSEVLDADLPPLFDGLKAAAREIGGRQIQNAATVAGNLCNASPAADGAPCLLSLDAAVELTSRAGKVVVPLANFLRGNRDTVRKPDQLMTAIVVPRPKGEAAGAFVKLGARAYLVISIVSVAAAFEIDMRRRLRVARVAIGSCAPTALRLPALEQALRGKACDGALAEVPAPSHFEALAPIDDVRASAAYRRDAAITLTRRLLGELGAGLGGAR